jgi:hypothetical protein
MRFAGTGLVLLALATAIHLDWHVARPTTHHLSLGLSWHWALAIPVFALAAWYVSRRHAPGAAKASAIIIGGAILLGAIIEPAWEYWLGGATFDWAWGPHRTHAALVFVITGIAAYAGVLYVLRRRTLSEKQP